MGERLVMESNEWQEMYSSNYLLHTLTSALGFDQRGIGHSTNSVCEATLRITAWMCYRNRSVALWHKFVLPLFKAISFVIGAGGSIGYQEKLLHQSNRDFILVLL